MWGGPGKPGQRRKFDILKWILFLNLHSLYEMEHCSSQIKKNFRFNLHAYENRRDQLDLVFGFKKKNTSKNFSRKQI